MPIFGHFPTKGVGKSDEDHHGSVCAVTGVLTTPGEEERKNNHLILLREPNLSLLPQKWPCQGKNRKNVI